MALNYKKTLQIIRERLIKESGFHTDHYIKAQLDGHYSRHIDFDLEFRSVEAISIIECFFDNNPEARSLLSELGGEWPMPDPLLLQA